jgi:hypothetical protein
VQVRCVFSSKLRPLRFKGKIEFRDVRATAQPRGTSCWSTAPRLAPRLVVGDR